MSPYKNRIRSSSGTQNITLPTKRASVTTSIEQIEIANIDFTVNKILKQIEHAYGKKSLKHDLVEDFVKISQETDNLSILLKETIMHTCRFLGIKTKIQDSLAIDDKEQETNQRIINMCHKLNADQYWNLPGGKQIYSESIFSRNSVNLNFLTVPSTINRLSILDCILGQGLKKL